MRGDQDAVRAAVLRIRRDTGLPVAFGGTMGRGARLHLTEFVGARGTSMQGLRVSSGAGLGGKAVALRRPVIVHDYATAAAITHDYDHAVVRGEGLGAVVGVPVVVGRSVRAVLYVAARGAARIGDRAVEAAVGRARLLEQDLAVREALAERAALADDTTGRWTRVDGARADLLALATKVADRRLGAELVTIADRLSCTPVPGPAPGTDPVLSPREVEVLTHVAVGRTNAEIGEQMSVGAETVKSYLRTLMRKLAVGNRIEAVVAARAAGLL
ncbi:helix-turn-helix transcriptional regulator [Speluncibacter jeojiensis]|uniref:helix-turn-helix transcriptional regulator n=1 Tax=Speluncibacter jeojiensis TaxID=2710754 RepID=UPI00240F769E|nr:helix-turn-helix transcriptional regulator [Rhodococcus sp. D2-41]